MNETQLPLPHWTDPLASLFFRFAAGGTIPSKWFEKRLPSIEKRAIKTGHLSLEVVSHCWNYSHLLAYQLSSLVNYPPKKLSVTMTVYYCAEDQKTIELLTFFSQQTIHNVTWNWQQLPKQQLFRRGIGRNLAALATKADWVWFTDCDLMFHEHCLDTLAEVLQGRNDVLYFPQVERCTSLLEDSDPMLNPNFKMESTVDIDTRQFTERYRSRATGPLQITHGDVARACGYCDAIALYQTPSQEWQKAREDRAFRWLLQSQGTPIDVPGVYRIRHVSKGRYTGNTASNSLRSKIRKLTSWWSELFVKKNKDT